MALSPQDKVYYEQRLSLRSFASLYAATVAIGTIACPLLLYVQDHANGLDAKWTSAYIFHVAVVGFILGTVVAAAMYVTFILLLQMGWLPSRR